MNDTFPSAEDFLDEMDRTLRADRRRRLIYGLMFWLIAAWLTGVIVAYLGRQPGWPAAAVLIVGLIVMLIREIIALRRYRMPDEEEP